ncbi:MAG: hypothetical protein OXO48_05385 [Caldilineaceae bacterium]|nr:hypothetical protein [Caldilineaceae bacterium]
MPRLFSYTVARDYGFAPNPFYGFCTLATCKPRIRKSASVGDWIVGAGTKTKGRYGRLVYAMRVSETMSFDEYWNDPRFRDKRPDMHASRKKAFGDNIYWYDDNTKQWRQTDSHHSYNYGARNTHNLRHDTQVDRILVSENFIYYGGSGPTIPRFHGCNLYFGRGHKRKYRAIVVHACIAWISSLDEKGYCGSPLEWA